MAAGFLARTQPIYESPKSVLPSPVGGRHQLPRLSGHVAFILAVGDFPDDLLQTVPRHVWIIVAFRDG